MDAPSQDYIERTTALIGCLHEARIDRIADLLDDHIVWEAPFAPQGKIRLEGKAAVMKGLGFLPTTFRRFRIQAQKMHPCPERNTVIVEATSLGIPRDNGPEYQNRHLIIFGYRDGRVNLWREYFNPYPLIWAGLAAGLAGESPDDLKGYHEQR